MLLVVIAQSRSMSDPALDGMMQFLVNDVALIVLPFWAVRKAKSNLDRALFFMFGVVTVFERLLEVVAAILRVNHYWYAAAVVLTHDDLFYRLTVAIMAGSWYMRRQLLQTVAKQKTTSAL